MPAGLLSLLWPKIFPHLTSRSTERHMSVVVFEEQILFHVRFSKRNLHIITPFRQSFSIVSCSVYRDRDIALRTDALVRMLSQHLQQEFKRR